MQNFYRLRVAQEARTLATLVYRVTRSFPREERFGLTSQLRDAAISVGLNIAEGCGRRTALDFRRFLYNANGSLQELEFGTLVAADLEFGNAVELRELYGATRRLGKMLQGLITKTTPSREKT